MKHQKESTELWLEIKNDIFRIDENGLFDYTKYAVYSLINSIAKDKEVTIKCSKELIEKLKTNKKQYKMTSDIDEVNIQYIRLYDYIKKDTSKYIKVYISIYFYDNTLNNTEDIKLGKNKDRYMNDVWIVTFKCDSNVLKKDTGVTCANCGSTMIYNKFNNTYECKYCKNSIKYDGAEEELEIVDIEIEE